MDYLDDFGLPQRTRQRIQRMEHEVVSTADAVVVTSKGALRALGVSGQKGFVIPNGWDRDDFPSPKEIEMDKPREGEKVIGHFGALYGARNPQALWDALEGTSPAWRVVLAGPVSADVRSKIDRANLHVTWLGDLPHKEAVRDHARLRRALGDAQPKRIRQRLDARKVFRGLGHRLANVGHGALTKRPSSALRRL
jgi:glycosyltransferase involved in cell wall biosynthesis